MDEIVKNERPDQGDRRVSDTITVPNPGEIPFGANRNYKRRVNALQLTWSVNGFSPWDAGYPLRAAVATASRPVLCAAR